MSRFRLVFVVLSFTLVFVSSARAQRGIGTLEGEEGPYKGATNEFGDRYALDGPTIRVFSSDGTRYHFVGNDNENLTFRMRVRAQCALGWQGRTATARIGGETLEFKTDRLFRSIKLEVPYASPDIPRTPVAACNREIDKRVSQGYSREELLSKGFVVPYRNAYHGRLDLSCSEIKRVGRSDLESHRVDVPLSVYVSCEASALAGEPEPPKEPTPRPRPAEVPGDVVTDVTLTADPSEFKGRCPRKVHFHGTITATEPTRVEYVFLGEEGFRTSKYELVFDRPGTRKVYWSRTIAPEADPSDLALRGGQKRYPVTEGYLKLFVGRPSDQDAPGSKVYGTSEPAEFRIDCNPSPEPRPMKVIRPPQP